MAKVFYTERDIDDLKARGVTSLDVTDNVVVTDVAAERAMKHGIKLNRVEFRAQPGALPSQFTNAASAAVPAGAQSAIDPELKEKIKAGVLARINGQVDPALLDAVITRVVLHLTNGSK
jgi:hypothetical protein